MEARDLINRMIQVDPNNRLGHNLESLGHLKQHPFFEGVDFAEVSDKSYTGLRAFIDSVKPTKLEETKEQARHSLMNLDLVNNPLANENAVVFKGHLCKKNWLGMKQIRFFELY